MKKITLLGSLILFSLSSQIFGQFGIHAGGVLSDMNMSSFGENYDTKMKAGFTTGLFYRQQVSPLFAIQPEANWIQKGAINNVDGEKLNITVNYLEVPVYILYSPKVREGFFGGIGPAINFGLRGHVKNGDQKQDITFGNTENNLKGYHFALNLIAGYTLKNGLQVAGFSGFSISDSSPFKGTDNDYMDINFFHAGIRIGFMDKKFF